jgi:DNA polymerase III alpha subunit
MTEHEVLSGTVHARGRLPRGRDHPDRRLEAYYRERRVTRSEVDARKKRGEDVEFWEYYHMVLMAKNIRGWRSLSLLSSESFRSGGYRKHCVDDELLDKWPRT